MFIYDYNGHIQCIEECKKVLYKSTFQQKGVSIYQLLV